MGITISIALLGLAAIGLFVYARRAQKADKQDEFGRNRASNKLPFTLKAISGGVTLVMLIITGLSVFYTQDPGEAKVLRSFTGEVVDTDTDEGLGMKAPWVDAVDYDIRNQVVSYIGDGNAKVKNSKGEEVSVTGPAIKAQDKDGATATINLIVRYSIEPSSVQTNYEQYGSQQNFETKLVQYDIGSAMRIIPLQYSTTQFRAKREEAALRAKESLATRWTGKGVTVDAVELLDIRYPDGVENSLQAVQEAINNANKASADLETAKIAAEKTRVEAQAQADYDQIVRCGASIKIEKMVINGKETNVSKVIPLQGKQCQNRLNNQVLTNKYLEALKEIANKAGNIIITDGKTVPIINTPAR